MLHSLSDIITFSRLCLTPIIVILAFIPGLQIIAWYCLLLAASTDAIDGYVARKFGTTSTFGSIFDSYTDKVLIIVMLFLLVVLGKLNYLHGLIPAFIITCRELFVFLLRFYAHFKNLSLQTKPLAKVKTALQMLGIILLLHPSISIYPHISGIMILWLAAILSIISALQYCHELITYKTKHTIITEPSIAE